MQGAERAGSELDAGDAKSLKMLGFVAAVCVDVEVEVGAKKKKIFCFFGMAGGGNKG